MHADLTMQHTNQEAVWPQSLYGNCRGIRKHSPLLEFEIWHGPSHSLFSRPNVRFPSWSLKL